MGSFVTSRIRYLLGGSLFPSIRVFFKSDIPFMATYCAFMLLFTKVSINGVESFDCRTASVLVRVILKSLQLELLSADHQSSLVRLLESWDRSAIGDIITSVRRCIKMGESRTDTLGLVCTHLSHVLEQSDFNKTDITLLISSFGRVLGLRSRLLRFFVTNASNVFSEFTAVSLAEYDETMARSKQEKYPPLSTDDVRRLRSELSRKESLLSILLDEVKSTDETPEASKNDKDELLWTIQREVTEIKRKLKRSGSEQNNLCLLLGESSNDQQVKQARSRFELSIALGKELLSELRSIHSRMVCMKNARAHAISDGMSISSAEDLSSIDVNNPSALIDALRKAVQESYAIKFRLAGVKNRVATEQDRIRRLKIQRAQTAAMANLKDDDVD
ncbi:hypothetical protein ACOME3_004646 [Neoechinorhynchus agilis]